MVKLSEMYRQIGEYLKANKDVEVLSIATHCGSSGIEYSLRLKSLDGGWLENDKVNIYKGI